MNNSDVASVISQCDAELAQIQVLISSTGATGHFAPYLTKYAVIRACGCIETSFKSVIADYCSQGSKTQVKRFIAKRIRDGSANPTMKNMCNLLNDIDENWNATFKAGIKAEPNSEQLRTSLQSLVDARNEFSHGGNPTVSISDVISYYTHAKRIIELMDGIVV